MLRYEHQLYTVLFPLVTFIAVVVILPFFLPLSLAFRFYRKALADRIHRNLGDKATIVSGEDAVWFQDTRTNMAIISGLMLMKGKPDIEKLRQVSLDRLVTVKKSNGEKLFPKFSQYSTRMFHRNVWVDEENFDIKEHIFVWDKSVPKTKLELQSLLGYLISQPLPEKKAHWQLIVVPSANKMDDFFYALLRVHHGVGDGVSLTKALLTKLVDVPPQIDMPVRFGSRKKWLMALKGIYKGPAMLIERLMHPAESSILHGPSLSGDKLVAWSEQLDLNMIKQMKNAAHCTVNDILMSCLAGAFREYFKRHSSVIPESIQASVPVDIRKPSADLEMDNQFSIVFLNLPLHLEDPLQCLFETKSRMDQIKHSPEPIVNAMALKYCMARLPSWSTKLSFDYLTDKCSMVLSNVPGPQQKMFIAGYPVEDIMFWPPQRSKVGIGISIFSYNGHVKMGLMVDRLLLTNPTIFVGMFERKVEDLSEKLSALVNTKQLKLSY